MHNISLINELKQAICTEDIIKIFENEKFPNKNGTLFNDKKIFGNENSDGNFFVHVKLDGEFEIAYKVIVYLKLYGLIGKKPFNSGITHWLNSFQLLLYEIKEIDSNIKKINDISSKSIDLLIEKKLKRVTAYTLKRQVNYFKDWIVLANQYLPYFLQLGEDLLLNSKLYPQLIKKSAEFREKEYRIENARQSYPLEDLKLMVSNSIKYIEEYSNEIIEITKLYTKIHRLKYVKRHEYYLDFFDSKKFANPQISKISKEILDYKSIEMILRNEIEMLEASCILIILFLTGMRIGEFVSLERHPKINEGEHFNLKRLVYKTAPNENGVELEMPIPEITKKAIEVLSILSDIKDNGFNKEITTTSIKFSKKTNAKSTRIRNLIRWYAKKLNIKEKIDPHQLRHAMAFLIVHLNEKDGLELARMFLGHTSISMTLQYMGHYNRELNEAIQELTKEESELFVEKITDQIKQNKKLFGQNGKRLMPNHKFVGQQAEDFVVLMKNGLLKLIENQKLAIIQTPISLCMHDLSKPEDLACQRGFDIENIVLNGPAPSKCKGANCSNALFFEEHVEKLKEQMYGNIDPDLKARLESNTFFIEAGGFEQDPFRKIIKDYDEYKNGVKHG